MNSYAPFDSNVHSKESYWVYRFWNAAGDCLYVGRVGDNGPKPFTVRLWQHKKKQSWWPEVDRIDAIELPDHASIVDEENRQFWEQRPIHNRRKIKCRHENARRSVHGQCLECRKEYRQSESGKAVAAGYYASPEGKATRRRANTSESAKAALKRYKQSDKGKAVAAEAQKRYKSQPEVKARYAELARKYKARKKARAAFAGSLEQGALF